MAFLCRTSVIRSALIAVQRSSGISASTSRFGDLRILTGSQRFCSSSSTSHEHENVNTAAVAEEDLPDPTMENPFLKEKRCCILCRYGVQVDYKNVRLLTQFVSPFTGRMYDKHITGLCETQHVAVKKEILRSIKFGLMSPFYRDPKYGNDPKLFDPTRPQRANPY